MLFHLLFTLDFAIIPVSTARRTQTEIRSFPATDICEALPISSIMHILPKALDIIRVPVVHQCSLYQLLVVRRGRNLFPVFGQKEVDRAGLLLTVNMLEQP